jgi:hypothetical protein
MWPINQKFLFFNFKNMETFENKNTDQAKTLEHLQKEIKNGETISMKSIIERIFAEEKSAGKNMSVETKLSLASLLAQLVEMLLAAVEERGYQAISDFTNLFSAYGKAGKRVRKGASTTFSALYVLHQIFPDTQVASPELDVNSKIDLVGGGFNVQIKSGKSLSVFSSREQLAEHVQSEITALQAYKSKEEEVGKWNDKAEGFLKMQIGRQEKALKDWDLMAAKVDGGAPLYVIFPWDLTKQGDFDKLNEIVAQFQACICPA